MHPDFKQEQDLAPILARLFEEKAERLSLPNGLIVLHKPVPESGLVSVQAWVKAGSIHEGRLLGSGLSHFLEHMLFKGTDKRPGPEITRAIQEAGGHINAYTSFERTVFYADAPAEVLPLALEMLGEALYQSVLPEEEVEKERDVILREIDMARDDPDRAVSRMLFSNAFRELPHRYPVIGHRDIFSALTRDDLWDYYQSRYAPNNTVLVIAGDAEKETLLAELEKTAFAASPRKRIPPSYVMEEPAQLALREEHLLGDVLICRGAFGFKIPSLTHPDAPGLDLLAAILGHGNSSILAQSLREKRKLVHHVDAVSWNTAPAGLLWISCLCDPGKREETQKALIEELNALADKGITKERLENARQQALVGEINARKTISGQAARLGMTEVVVGDLNYPRDYFNLLCALTPDGIKDLAQKYLTERGLTSVSLNARDAPAAPSVQPSVYKEPPDFELRTLDNGARLLCQRDPSLPKVHLRFASFGGPLYEDPAKRGITGLMATLLTKDTEFRGAAEVAQSIEAVGGSFAEFAGNNSWGLSMEVLAKDFELASQLLEDAVTRPAFKEASFTLERDAQIAQVREDMDELLDMGRKMLRQRFFGPHPYGVDAYGTEETLRSITVEDLQAFYKRQVVGANAVLAVAGDFNPDEDSEDLEMLLSALPDWAFMQADKPFAGPETGEKEIETPREQALLMQAYPGAGLLDEDYYAGELIEEMCNEMSGRLFSKVREDRALAYYVGAERVTGLNTGMFYLYAGTKPDTRQEILAEFNAEIARLRKGQIEEKELKRCQTRLKTLKRMSLQTIGGRGMQAALNTLFGRPPNDWKNYGEKISAVTVKDLQQFAKKHFAVTKRVVLILRPEKEK